MQTKNRICSLLLALSMCLFVVPFLFTPAAASGTSAVSVMSYNIKNDNFSYGSVDSMVEAENPDIIGMQEVTGLQWTLLKTYMRGNGYNEIQGQMRGTSSLFQANECNPIFYKADKFALHNFGTFWLSDTPDVKSKYSDSNYYRICTWVVLQVLGTQDYMIVFNTHLDTDATARFKQSKVLLQQMVAAERNCPGARDNLIILGDLNMMSSTPMFRYLTGDVAYGGQSNTYTWTRFDESRQIAASVTPNSFGNNYTNPSNNPVADLDHILVTFRGFSCTNYKVVSDAAGSDHLPIVAQLQMNAPTS